MQTIWAISLTSLLIIIGYFSFSSTQNANLEIQELDRTLVNDYCQAIINEDFENAYRNYLSADYQQQVTLAAFSKAHQQRRSEVGVIINRKIIWTNSSINLINRIKTYQILYEIQYANQNWQGWMVLNNADDQWRIEGTYVTISTGLNFKLW